MLLVRIIGNYKIDEYFRADYVTRRVKKEIRVGPLRVRAHHRG